jgi:hypothetical protein
VARLQARLLAAGRPPPAVVPLAGLPLDDAGQARAQLQALRELGVTGFVHAARYEDEDDFARVVERLVATGGGA